MAALQSVFSQIQFRLRRTSIWVKLVLAVTILLSMAALISLRICIREVQTSTAALRERAVTLEQSNDQIREDMADLGSVRSVIRIAEEKLGLVQPGTILFQIEP